MTIALISNTVGAGLNGATSDAVDTTGANLLVIAVASSSGTITVSDNKSNTYTPLTSYVSSSQAARLYYCASPTVGVGHTFTVSGTTQVINFRALAYSGASGTPLDLDSGFTYTAVEGTAIDDATFLPSENNCLVISAHCLGGLVSGYTAHAGMTSLGHNAFSPDNYYGLGVVHAIQTTATAYDPATTTVASWTTAVPIRVASAAFKAASGGGGGGGELTAGESALASVNNSAVNLSNTGASGGTTPYTYQWHRSATANFSPSGGTAISGATSTSYSDTGASPDTVYFYKLVATDATSTSVTSNQIAGVLKSPPLIIGCLGDSITKGTFGPSPAPITATQRLASQLKSTYVNRDVTVVNAGVDGASAQDFAANAGGIMTAASSAFSSAGCTHVLIMLGANDAGDHRTGAQYLADMQTIAASLVADGYVVVINYPTYIPAGANSGATDEAATESMRSYIQQIDALVDGADVLSGDRLAYQYFVDNYETHTQTDKTHLNDAGNISLASMWARAFDRAVLQISNVTSPLVAQTVTVTLVNTSGASLPDLSSIKWAWWDQADLHTLLAPTCTGNAETTDSSGELTIPIISALPSGDVGWLVITDSDGTVTQSPAHRAFSGPVELD